MHTASKMLFCISRTCILSNAKLGNAYGMRDFRLQQRFDPDLRSFWLLRIVEPFLTDRLSRNVCKKLPFCAA